MNDLHWLSSHDVHKPFRSKSKNIKKNDLMKDICILCKHKKCLVDLTEKKFNSGPITRSITRWQNCLNNFLLIEVYRSMPLLGDEWEIPNWDVHLDQLQVKA